MKPKEKDSSDNDKNEGLGMRGNSIEARVGHESLVRKSMVAGMRKVCGSYYVTSNQQNKPYWK